MVVENEDQDTKLLLDEINELVKLKRLQEERESTGYYMFRLGINSNTNLKNENELYPLLINIKNLLEKYDPNVVKKSSKKWKQMIGYNSVNYENNKRIKQEIIEKIKKINYNINNYKIVDLIFKSSNTSIENSKPKIKRDILNKYDRIINAKYYNNSISNKNPYNKVFRDALNEYNNDPFDPVISLVNAKNIFIIKAPEAVDELFDIFTDYLDTTFDKNIINYNDDPGYSFKSEVHDNEKFTLKPSIKIGSINQNTKKMVNFIEGGTKKRRNSRNKKSLKSRNKKSRKSRNKKSNI